MVKCPVSLKTLSMVQLEILQHLRGYLEFFQIPDDSSSMYYQSAHYQSACEPSRYLELSILYTEGSKKIGKE